MTVQNSFTTTTATTATATTARVLLESSAFHFRSLGFNFTSPAAITNFIICCRAFKIISTTAPSTVTISHFYIFLIIKHLLLSLACKIIYNSPIARFHLPFRQTCTRMIRPIGRNGKLRRHHLRHLIYGIRR